MIEIVEVTRNENFDSDKVMVEVGNAETEDDRLGRIEDYKHKADESGTEESLDGGTKVD